MKNFLLKNDKILENTISYCVFCGSNDVHIIEGYKGNYVVRCFYCMAQGPDKVEDWQAVAAWNSTVRCESKNPAILMQKK